jgi:hypothetical protein
MLPLHEWELPENAPRQGIWLPQLQRERQAELGEFAGPHIGCYNIVGRNVWWQNRDVDDVLQENGYPFTSARSAPMHSMSRSSSSDGRSAARSVPYPRPAHGTDIVIRDAGGSSSAPPRREKKEPEEEE